MITPRRLKWGVVLASGALFWTAGTAYADKPVTGSHGGDTASVNR
ncbi:hypothetical protein [Streptomyces sp. NBC_00078]|nr:hypothetical protein [Streptomyces sp. NBC_00078]MCX5422892.1 hypothetical protein [Streptomyces sp. NBC_00078]